jgi:hypothetical protein
VNVIREGRNIPRVIMLGHISSQRNKPKIAIKETVDTFKKAGIEMKFKLAAAPLRECCERVEIS